MSLSRKIAAALDAAGPLPRDVEAADGPHRLSLRLTAGGPVGLAFDALDFRHDGHPGLSPEGLRAWGDRVASRVTYLMEPLVVLEADPVVGEVALRSQSPTPREGRRSYYEVRLDRRGSLRLARVAFDEAERRRKAVDCQLTREVLERLADDLAASLP
jgi:hypothetical protein